MRPPPQRNFVGVATQIRPTFSAPSGPTPAPDRNNFAAENKDSLMTQACLRGHQTNAMPLLEVNRYRSMPIGDYGRSAPSPKLAPRPNVMPKPGNAVKTWE